MRVVAIISVELTKVSTKKQAPCWHDGGYIIYRKEGPLSILHLLQINFIKRGGPLGNKVKNSNLLKKFLGNKPQSNKF